MLFQYFVVKWRYSILFFFAIKEDVWDLRFHRSERLDFRLLDCERRIIFSLATAHENLRCQNPEDHSP
jgi:hypothetical protein